MSVSLCNSLCNHVKNMTPFMNKNNGTFHLFLLIYFHIFYTCVVKMAGY